MQRLCPIGQPHPAPGARRQGPGRAAAGGGREGGREPTRCGVHVPWQVLARHLVPRLGQRGTSLRCPQHPRATSSVLACAQGRALPPVLPAACPAHHAPRSAAESARRTGPERIATKGSGWAPTRPPDEAASPDTRRRALFPKHWRTGRAADGAARSRAACSVPCRYLCTPQQVRDTCGASAHVLAGYLFAHAGWNLPTLVRILWRAA